MSGLMILSMVFPAAAGIYLLLSLAVSRGRLAQPEGEALKRLHLFTGAVLCITSLLALAAAWCGREGEVTLFYLMKDIPVYFHIDELGRLFVTVISIVWTAAGFYSFVYMKHEGKERQYFGFYLLVYGVLIAQTFAGNMVTLYLFYELMTLTSMPLVLHNGSREARMAALKYLFYSMCGAYMGLFGIFFLYRYCDTLAFTAGGTLNAALAGGNSGILLIAVFVMLVGFGVKAGMLPFHAWLPTAHPVAPSPASAVLSGIIVKSGVLAIIRVVYYLVGPDFIRGTWVQTAWMTMALITVFMGSLLAFKEPVFKKRLAYSTVSQVSYILFGLAVLSPLGVSGALLHTVFHAFIKSTLFLTAGIFIYQCGKTRVEEFAGIGKQMPKTLWCYTIAALALIGIPPTSGFISKWYLAQGALNAQVGVFGWLGPVVLLVSALLTAGYLLPVTMKGFLPGSAGAGEKERVAGTVQPGETERVAGTEQPEETERAAGTEQPEETERAAGTEQPGETERAAAVKEPPAGMLVPLAVLAALALVFGLIPNPLIDFVSRIAASVM